VELIRLYFPGLSEKQYTQLEALYDLYMHWNAQINVISRKDMDQFYERHVLHSLAIAKVMPFLPGASVLDVGTGGGFPGLPLAILFPETRFHLVDSIGKKIKVVNEVAQAIGLSNLQAEHLRAEQVDQQFDFVVSRAVTRFAEFYPWVKGKFKKENRHELANGILYLKGGELDEEIREMKRKAVKYPIPVYFKEEFFETKFVVYVPA
jgi:16S rRNA (guanine527-N7)-methyltransferase